MTQLLTDRFGEALVYAERAHRAQTRKGTTIPYVAHLLAVASLVLEHGGGEDQAIAALLHDVVEDQGGAAAAAEIRARFGDRVADIVLACTDTEATPKPPWRARKEAYVASVAGKSDDAILVTAADKLHNASAILEDYRVLGEALWPRFTGGRDGTLWYYRALADAIAARSSGRLSLRLARAVEDLEAVAAPQA
jgi:(p)ppGpp synthase/HD superfamily hydrolase